MSGVFRNAWAEYVRYKEDSRKKIVIGRQKLEMPQLADWLRSLSTQLREIGDDMHAAFINEEIARIYLSGKQVNFHAKNEARKELLVAARLTANAVHSIPLDVPQLYTKVIDMTVAMGWTKSAGLIALEAAKNSWNWRDDTVSRETFTEIAVRLLEGELHAHSVALLLKAELLMCKCAWSEMLSFLDDVWMMCMKSQDGSSPAIHRLLQECEVSTAVLLCKLSANNDDLQPSDITGRHKLLLESYALLQPAEVYDELLDMGRDTEAKAFKHKHTESGANNAEWMPADCSLQPVVYWKVRAFILHCYNRDFEVARKVLRSSENILPTFSNQLLKVVLDDAMSMKWKNEWIVREDPAWEKLPHLRGRAGRAEEERDKVDRMDTKVCGRMTEVDEEALWSGLEGQKMQEGEEAEHIVEDILHRKDYHEHWPISYLVEGVELSRKQFERLDRHLREQSGTLEKKKRPPLPPKPATVKIGKEERNGDAAITETETVAEMARLTVSNVPFGHDEEGALPSPATVTRSDSCLTVTEESVAASEAAGKIMIEEEKMDTVDGSEDITPTEEEKAFMIKEVQRVGSSAADRSKEGKRPDELIFDPLGVIQSHVEEDSDDSPIMSP